jgi:Icc-related predicted phosphoesterase
MTRLIVLPDLHSQADSLKQIARPLMDVDAVILAGDMTNGSTAHLLRVFAVLEEFNEHIYAVPGNLDTDAILAHLSREGLNLHRTHQMLDGMALCGVGGALPFAGKFVFNESQFAQFLNDSITGVPESIPKILISHQPPYNTLVDCLPDGTHVGSKSVRAFIEATQPLICFSGHIHQAQGIEQLGSTYLVNPGPLWDSHSYAYTEIEEGRVQTVEIRRIS